MADYIAAIILILVFLANIVVMVWSVKKQCKEQRIHSQMIYVLYKEIKRRDDKEFGEEEEQ